MTSLNVGNIDRALRILIGLVLCGLAAAGRIEPWGYAGALLLLTGVVAFCPVYRLLGWRTTWR